MNAAKALLAALIAAVGVLVAAATDNSITLAEWLTAVSAALGALGAVYLIPNKVKE